MTNELEKKKRKENPDQLPVYTTIYVVILISKIYNIQFENRNICD